MKTKKVIKSTAPKINPTPGYVLIELVKPENRTETGIYLPDSAIKKHPEGMVVAVGEAEILDCGTKREPPVKVGDWVFYKKLGKKSDWREVKFGGNEYVFSKFEDILGIKK